MQDEFKGLTLSPFKKMYLVVRGSYSDYTIVSASSTRAQAEAFVLHFGSAESDDYEDDYRIEEMGVDEYDPYIEKKEFYYSCRISTETLKVDIERQDLGSCVGLDLERLNEATTLPDLEGEYEQAQIHELKTYPIFVWAKDKGDAKKQALALVQAYMHSTPHL
jgi:hypothetical protein